MAQGGTWIAMSTNNDRLKNALAKGPAQVVTGVEVAGIEAPTPKPKTMATKGVHVKPSELRTALLWTLVAVAVGVSILVMVVP
jgi:hypothetical protein